MSSNIVIRAFDRALNRLLVMGMPFVGLLPITRRRIRDPIMNRYVAGQTLEECLGVVREYCGRNMVSIIDVLGEAVDSIERVNRYKTEYLKVIAAAHELKQSGIPADISLKLSQLGLGEERRNFDMCAEALEEIVKAADENGLPLWIDMEDTGLVDATLELWTNSYRAGKRDVGIVIQAYLKRTADDVEYIAKHADGAMPRVRLVKGVYDPPAAVAYKRHSEIFHNWNVLVRMMFERGMYVALATQNENAISDSLDIVKEMGIPKERYEFQIMYGVGEHIAARMAKDYLFKVYMPFGDFDSAFAYVLRRCKKNPTIARAALRTFLKGRQKAL